MNKNECYKKTEELFLQKQGLAEQKQKRNIEQVEHTIPGITQINKQLADISGKFFSEISGGEISKDAFESIKDTSLDLQRQRAELLYQNGYPIDYLDKQYECKLCKDTGYIQDEICKCFKKVLAEEYLKNSNLQTIYKNKTFKSFDITYYAETDHMQKVYDYCKKYVTRFGKQCIHMLFSGVPGCGKTHMSCAIGTSLINNGYFVLYTPVQQMISDFEAFTFKNEKDADLDIYSTCDLLIIDDLGAEMQTSFSDSVLYNVINNRINLKRPMIVSTNLSTQELQHIYHERLCSRLVYEFAKLPFSSTDVRREKESRLKNKKQEQA